MAFKYTDNINFQSKKPNFERDLFDTIANMASFREEYLPDVFIASCKEDGNVYVFNRKNEVDEVTGKWRLLGGSSGSLQSKITTIFSVGGVKEGKVLEAGKSIEDVIRNILAGEKEVDMPSYYGISADKTTDLTLLTKIEPVSNFTITVSANNEYVVIACPIDETNVKIFSNGFDYTSSFKTVEQSSYRFFYSETKITCKDFDYTITYN